MLLSVILGRSQKEYRWQQNKTSDLHFQGEMGLPSSLKFPIQIHKKAHKAIIIEKKRKGTPFLLALFKVVVSLPAATMVGMIFTLLKLDIRFRARFTKGFSAADAGVVGIDSTKAQRAEENLFVVTPSGVRI